MVIGSFGVLAILIVSLQLRAFYKISQYKKKIDKKNKQLMQFYLDTKFISKGLVDSLVAPHSTNFCNSLIEQIKNYYNLEEIIIIDSVRMLAEKDPHTTTKNAVINFVKADIEPMLRMLSGHNIKKFNMKISDEEYVLYVSKLVATEENDGVIICVEMAPSLLNKNEKISLENSINLLKNRLLYE